MDNLLYTEVNKIKEIAWKHGYSENIVNKILEEIKLKRESKGYVNKHILLIIG